MSEFNWDKITSRILIINKIENVMDSSELVKKSTKKAKKQNLSTPTTFSLIHTSDFVAFIGSNPI